MKVKIIHITKNEEGRHVIIEEVLFVESIRKEPDGYYIKQVDFEGERFIDIQKYYIINNIEFLEVK